MHTDNMPLQKQKIAFVYKVSMIGQSGKAKQSVKTHHATFALTKPILRAISAT